MIVLNGVAHITTREACELLAPDVTPALVQNWVRRSLIKPVAKLDRSNVFRYVDVLEAERRTNASRAGRPRLGRTAHPSLLKIGRTGTISEQVLAVDPALFEDVVYYIRFGDRIKIGYSSTLPTRLANLPYDELLVAEPGSYQLEQFRHRQFAEHRVPRQREWYRINDHLISHVAMLIGHFGPLRTLQQARG